MTNGIYDYQQVLFMVTNMLNENQVITGVNIRKLNNVRKELWGSKVLLRDATVLPRPSGFEKGIIHGTMKEKYGPKKFLGPFIVFHSPSGIQWHQNDILESVDLREHLVASGGQ